VGSFKPRLNELTWDMLLF